MSSPFEADAMDLESADQRTDKERFFEGLYSIPTDDDPLETSEVTLLLAASRDQRNIVKRFRTRSTRAPTTTPGPSGPPRITRASTMPLPKSVGLTSSASSVPAPLPLPPSLPASTLPQPSPPPESSRLLSSSAAGRGKKRKRVSKATPTPTPSAKKLIFKDLYFYFVPNDLKNPARKFRAQKTDENGGFCLNEWREKSITHVIVDSRLNYDDVLKYLKRDSIPEHMIVVNEIFIGDCLDFNRIVDYDQPQYKVPGDELSSSPQLPELSGSAIISTTTSMQSLQPKSTRRSRRAETPQSTQELSSALCTSQRSEASPEEPAIAMEAPAVSGRAQKPAPDKRLLEGMISVTSRTTMVPPSAHASAPSSTSEQRVPERLTTETVPERLKDELDIMIEEAQRMGDLPSLDDDDEADKKDSSVKQDTSSEDEGSLTRRKKKKIASKLSKSEKLGGWQGTFQCMQKNDGAENDENPNKRTIDILSEMQKYYEMTGDQWRSISYRKAINTLKKQEKKIVFASEARELFNIGQSIAEKIEEIVRTDHLRKLDYSKLEPADAALKLFMGIYGVGPSLAHKWVQAGYKTLEDLKTKTKLSQSQKIGVDHYDDFNCRIPREEVRRHGDIVMQVAASIDPELQLEIMGSYRRGAKDCGDIDIMITKEDASASWLSQLLDMLVEKLFTAKFLQCELAIPRGRDDGSKWHGASKVSNIPQWRRIDFLVVPWDERGAALLYFTGNDIFNRSMRLLASKKGYGLNQRGLFKNVMRGPHREKLTDGTKVEGKDEKRIFEILGVPYRMPEERIC